MLHIYMYLYIPTYIYIYLHIPMPLYIYTYTYIYMPMPLHIYLYRYIYAYIQYNTIQYNKTLLSTKIGQLYIHIHIHMTLYICTHIPTYTYAVAHSRWISLALLPADAFTMSVFQGWQHAISGVATHSIRDCNTIYQW